MRTVNRSNASSADRRPPRPPLWSRVGPIAAALVGLPLVLAAIGSQWGVIVVIVLSVLTGLALWVRQRGFAFIQLVAFLIHFDGIGAGPIRMGRIVAVVAGILIIHKLLSGWRPPAIPTRHWMPVALMILWAILSGVWAESSSSWFYAMGQYGLAVIFFAITAFLVDSHEKVHQFLRAYWIGGVAGSAGGIFGLAIGARSVGFGGDPNFFGLLEASMIPLTVYYRRNAPTAQLKLIYTLVLIWVLAGAAGAGSRSGLIGGAIAIVGTMVTRPGLTAMRRASVGIGSIVVAAFAFVIGFVANPNNLQRGFADRGAGRLDTWAVSLDLIREAPIIGHGLGQQALLIVPNLLVTPGSQLLTESRESVSSHNTWLDIMGDLGIVGLLLFLSVLVIAAAGLARPRWRSAKQLSTALFVMMLPVMSGSMFLPLINNKLAWALVGLSAALQVPSWGARWTGLHGPPRDTGPPVTDPAPEPADPASEPPDPGGDRPWESVQLARWDLRVSRRFRAYIVLGALVGGFVAATVSGTLPTRYTASAGVLTPRMDGPESLEWVAVDRSRMQGVLTMVVSGAYALELQQLSGIDLTPAEIRDRMMVTKPNRGFYLKMEYSDTDRSRVEAVLPHVVTALERVYERSQEEVADQVANELRAVVPGEQRYYTGDFFSPAFSEPMLEVNPPRVLWMTFVGALAGAFAAAILVQSQQRLPRVNNDDDFAGATGLSVWAHVGRRAGRHGATRAQYAHVVAAARDRLPPNREPTRLVVSTPEPDRSVRGLAVGVAAALAAEGRRVVLVDAQLDRPALSLQLGGFTRPGLAEVGAGRARLGDAVRRVHRWRMPRAARRAIGRGPNELRFLPAGRMRRSADRLVPLEIFDHLDPDVYVVLLAPSTLGDVANAPVLGWGDVVVLGLVEGRTVTFDAEDAAARVHSFGAGPGGIVLLDV